MAKLWDADELAWARECFHAGDSVEEIAESAGRTIEDVAGAIGGGRKITPYERRILSLYSAGCTFPEIAGELRMSKKAASAAITGLRRKGIPVPHRTPGHALGAELLRQRFTIGIGA